jgi:hypothetical protein
MDYTNLQLLAEVSVALLGFSGITAIVGHSRFAQQGVVYRLQGLLYSSSLALIGSILPSVGIPMLPAAVVIAASNSAALIWAGIKSFGRSRREIQPNPALVATFFPIAGLVNLNLWWSIFSRAEQLLFSYQLQIGVLILLATTYFVRLVSSAFDTKDTSGSD